MRSDDLLTLPPDLPVPVDDGGAHHLPGLPIPPLGLPSTAGRTVRLDEQETSEAEKSAVTVVYVYPRTGRPDEDAPPGLDAIPGARGCTPQSCAYRDHHAEIRQLGGRVFGLSTQATAYQREMAERLHLPYEVLSDERLELTRALGLPTFQYRDWTLNRRCTLLLERGRIADVFYPVFPPDADASRVLGWLRTRRDYRVRPAVVSDLPHLPAIEEAAARVFEPLALQVLGEAGDGVSPAAFAAAQEAGLLWVAATPEGTPVGFALVELREPGAAHLRELDVLPEHGRRGAGRRLVREVQSWARQRGFSSVTLTTFRDVPWNAPWYQRLGFRVLAPGELSPALRQVLTEEVRGGIGPEGRVAMRWDIAPA
jgi:peroxiredoxin/GNAT superfamily N-acetyltransferase